MSRVLVIGCGGVANVAIRKCCQMMTFLGLHRKPHKIKVRRACGRIEGYDLDKNHHGAGGCGYPG